MAMRPFFGIVPALLDEKVCGGPAEVFSCTYALLLIWQAFHTPGFLSIADMQGLVPGFKGQVLTHSL